MTRQNAGRVGRLVAITGAVVACAENGVAPDEQRDDPGAGAIVSFAFRSNPQDTMLVEVRDTTTVRLARAYVTTGRGPHIPSGYIVRGAGVDPRYPFHFVPASVRLAEVTIELCDGAPMRTPQAVDAYMRGATGQAAPDSARWCPWSAYPVAVR
jgi:hypothetical protein